MRRRLPARVVAITAMVMTASWAGPAQAAPLAPSAAPVSSFDATPVNPDGEPVNVPKSASGKIAQSDPELLKRTDSAQVAVMVKLDYDGAASYQGGLDGLPATSPGVTGKQLNKKDKNVDAYLKHAKSTSESARAAIEAAVPSADVRFEYSIAYGGLSVQLPASDAKKLLDVPGVVAVQNDSVEQPQTDASTKFIGATEVWPKLGGSKTAGKGVIVGVIDTGIWPEHPSFADPGIPKPAGGPWACQFGDGSNGPAFQCNDKLIGAYAFLATSLLAIDVTPANYCTDNGTTGTCSARDANGHGTHTASTSAGSPVAHTPLFGADRGAISGVAPGASVIAYRVCVDGCYSSDSVAAIQQAILDGVDVINFSISGGNDAYSDPVELAFLDAFEAGISVNASAGNDGPGDGTSNHAGPWVTTVAASTSDRHFQTELVLTADNGDTFKKAGSTVTAPLSDTPVVQAINVPGYTGGELCDGPFAAGSVSGKVVVCVRGGPGRVEKGYNALQGGAAGMILLNPTPQSTNTDNHFLPAIHLEGPNDDLLAFLNSHTGVVGHWAASVATKVPGDVMAAFSSRGPLGDFLKPDITAPGVQILAGTTPTPTDVASGPPGQLFMAIAGTSMASPHSAGASALLKAAHPDWSPAQIKSAIMTSTTQKVVKEDGTTPATPHDRGAGSLRVNRAISPTVTLDVTAEQYRASATDKLGRIDLNVPSINANPMPGAVTTSRTVKNVSGQLQVFKVSATVAGGVSATVFPSVFALKAGQSKTFKVHLDGTKAAAGWHFGQVKIDAAASKAIDAVLPIAVNNTQGELALTHSCDPTTVPRRTAAHCTATVTNMAPVPAPAKLTVNEPWGVEISNVSAPARATRTGLAWEGTLTPALAPKVAAITPSVSPGGGYLPLRTFGIPADGYGDETVGDYTVPAFKWGSETYTKIGVDSNGYVVIGGITVEDNKCCDLPAGFPDPARPNNVIAPFWTDLDPSIANNGGGIRVGTLSGGGITWLVVDWEAVNPYGQPALDNSFQVWIQLGDTEATWISYGAMAGADPTSDLLMGAENRDGTSGVNVAGAANTEWAITTAPSTPGGSVTVTYDASSWFKGTYPLRADVTSPVVKGTTSSVVKLTVK